MPSLLNPYLTFGGNAREAMTFYQAVFGGKLDINTFDEYGGAPDGLTSDGVMHARLETPSGYTLMASDGPPADISSGSTITLSVSGPEAEELRGYYEKLAEGGAVQVPLSRQVWGDEFGMLTDKFGIGWMVNITQN